MAGLTHVAKESGLDPVRCSSCGSRVETTEAIREFFRTILAKVKRGEKVYIKDFGVFSAKLLKGRKVKTPLMEGGSAEFPDLLVLRFHQAQTARDELNRQAGPQRRKRKKKTKGSRRPKGGKKR